jgi:Flp pilus assembly protein TadG
MIMAGCMVAFIAFSGLSIDVGLLYTARNQLQQALDMAAIRGAAEMISLPDVNEIAPYVQGTLEANPVLGDTSVDWQWDVSIRGLQDDVADTVVVSGTYPVRPFFMNIFGFDTVNVETRAMAKLVSVSGVYCVLPYTLTDRFNDRNGNGIYDAGEYYNALTTGYHGSLDVGDTLVVSYQDLVNPPHLRRVYGVAYNGGGDFDDVPVDEFECNSGNQVIGVGMTLNLTDQPDGIMGMKAEYRIGADSTASWDPNTMSVVNSVYSRYKSPRIVKAPIHTPMNPAVVRKLMCVFINQSYGDSVQVITMNILNIGDVDPSADESSFIKSAHLVQ